MASAEVLNLLENESFWFHSHDLRMPGLTSSGRITGNMDTEVKNLPDRERTRAWRSTRAIFSGPEMMLLQRPPPTWGDSNVQGGAISLHSVAAYRYIKWVDSL